MDDEEYTARERRILEYVEERRGEAFVEDNEDLILAQADLIGER